MNASIERVREGVTTEEAKPYHHGDLREKLLEAAGQILEEGGVETLSLRECARRAGVSHAAPAHHFKTKSALLAAYAARSFDEMHDLTERYMDEAGADPWDRLKAIGRAYIDYSLAHAATYDLMHRCNAMPPEWNTDEYRAIRGRGRKLLEGAIAACSGRTGRELAIASTFAWVVVHGYVSLLSDGKLILPEGEGYEEQARHLADDLLEFMRPVFGKTG